MEFNVPTICHLVHSLHIGGAEVLVARLARQNRGRFRFVFLCLDELGTLGQELMDEGFEVYVVGRRPGVDLRCVKQVAEVLRAESVHLVHAHQYTPFFYAAAGRLQISRRLPVLYTEHGRHHPDYPRWKRLAANRFLLRPVDRVVAVGADVRLALIRNEGLPPGRVGVIHNGIPLDRFTTSAGERALVRAELDLSAHSPVLIQVARLDYLKDHATAVLAMSHVARERPDARLLLVGEGPERAALEDRVRRLGLEPYVRFLGQRCDVSRLLAAADICLLTSISEGIPLTLIEAMAAGLPVVATAVGGVRDVVADGRTGYLAPSGDALGLAGHLLSLMSEPSQRERMGRLGRARAQSMFSERRMHEGYVALYGELVRLSRHAQRPVALTGAEA